MESLIGKRVELISMKNDPQPIEGGSIGTIIHVGGGVMNVDWDNGRKLGLVVGEDEFRFVDELPKHNNLVFSGNI